MFCNFGQRFFVPLVTRWRVINGSVALPTLRLFGERSLIFGQPESALSAVFGACGLMLAYCSYLVYKSEVGRNFSVKPTGKLSPQFEVLASSSESSYCLFRSLSYPIARYPGLFPPVFDITIALRSHATVHGTGPSRNVPSP